MSLQRPENGTGATGVGEVADERRVVSLGADVRVVPVGEDAM